MRAGEYEAIYGDVPEAGLAAAGRAVPLAGNSSARLRLRRTAAEGRGRLPGPRAPEPAPTAEVRGD